MSTEELRDLARGLSSDPADPTLYERLLDAAAITRCGLELLQELAEQLDERRPPIRPIPDLSQLAAFRPGDRLVDADGEETRTDPLDVAAEHLRLSLGAGSTDDLQELLATLTATGLAKERLATLVGFLSQLPPEALERLRSAAAAAAQTPQEGRSLLNRVADAMLPHPEGRDGDLLLFAGDRIRDALSLIRTGREMLQDIVALLRPMQGEPVDPADFVPGLPVRLFDIAVPTDPLELLQAELGALLASTPDAFAEVETWLAALIGSLDSEGRPVGALSNYLTEEVLAELAGALALPFEGQQEAFEDAISIPPPMTSRRNHTNLGQLIRALERATAQLPTIEAAWQMLSSPESSFARRFAAGVVLCRKTRELVRERPKEASAWAATVARSAEELGLSAEPFQVRSAAFLSAFASAHIGNALRVEGHLRMADRFFLPFEEDDLLGLKAEYLGLKAALRQGERQYREAFSLLEEADAIARRGGFPGALDTAARIRVTEGRILMMLGEFDAAAAFLSSAVGTTAPLLGTRAVIPAGALSPSVRWMVLQNLADCLSKAGSNEAASLLSEVEALGLQIGLSETEGLRTAWIRARIRLSEDWLDAVETLRIVRARFIELGFLFDAALASLELATWYAEQISGSRELPDVAAHAEHVHEIRQLAAESARFFVGADITPEAVAALALFQYVAAVSTPEPATIRKIERLFQQAASF